MIVILCHWLDPPSGQPLVTSPSIDLLNSPFLDQLARRYRALGARKILWQPPTPKQEQTKHKTQSGWEHFDPQSIAATRFGRYETALIADYRLWPDETLQSAISQHEHTAASLTTLFHTQNSSPYQEILETPQTLVRRNYHPDQQPHQNTENAVAILACPRSLPVVWDRIVNSIEAGAKPELTRLAKTAQLMITHRTTIIATMDQYLHLVGRLLDERQLLPPAATMVRPGVWAMPGARLASDASVSGTVLLGRNATIEPRTRLVGPIVVGDHARVGQGSFVGESVIGHHTTLGAETYLWRSVIESGSTIAPGRVISFRWLGRSDARHLDPNAHDLQFHSVLVPSRRHRPRIGISTFNTIKRLIDITGALIGLALTLPLYPFIALAIKLDSPGPIFFIHKRQTLGGKEFGCIKFRTMVRNAHTFQRQLPNEVDGPQFHIENDPRLTRVGKFLRRTNIDELPQLWNVLVGHMSLVGPRPSPDEENQYCPAWREARLSVRPGLTGMWQVYRENRAAGDFHQWILYDTRYVREASLRTDLHLLWQTLLRFLKLTRLSRAHSEENTS